jgi:hypothetical protein
MTKSRPGNEGCKQGANVADTFKPGEIVKVSGIYSVVFEGGDCEGRTFETTCVEGDRFPRTRTGAGAHYELKHGAPYSYQHPELNPGR